MDVDSKLESFHFSKGLIYRRKENMFEIMLNTYLAKKTRAQYLIQERAEGKRASKWKKKGGNWQNLTYF